MPEHLAILEHSLKMEQQGEFDADTMGFAETILGNMGGGGNSGLLNSVAGMISQMGALASGSATADGTPAARLDITHHQYETLVGPLKGEPGENVVRAAKIVLVAADEARKACKSYGKPEYLNDSQVSRNWMESRSEPVRRQITTIDLD